jgi:HK97 family phage major capsid protein
MDPELELLKKEQEIRSLPEQFKNDKEGFDKALAEKSAELRALKQQIDQARMPSQPRSAEAQEKPWADLAKAIIEKRSVTMNGGQGSRLVQDIFALPGLASKLYSKVNQVDGPFGEVVVPCFNPSPARPAAVAEGGSVSADSTGVYAGKTLTLKPWISTLPVSVGLWEGLSVDGFKDKLVGIFSDAFLSSIDNAAINGTGSAPDSLGVFVAAAGGVPTSQDITGAAATSFTLVDLLTLVAAIRNRYNPEDCSVVLNGSFISAMLAESSSSFEGIKNEILLKGSIRGVEIIESGNAPTTLTAGSYVAVAGNFKRGYTWGRGLGLRISPIESATDDLVNVKATMYMGGLPHLGTAFYRLKTKAGT